MGDLNLLNDEGIPEFNSYEEFISLLEKVKEGNPDITPLALRGQGTHPLRLWYTFYKQQGGEIYIVQKMLKRQLIKRLVKIH